MRRHQQRYTAAVDVAGRVEPARPGLRHIPQPFLFPFITGGPVFIADDLRVLDHKMFAVLLEEMYVQPFRQFGQQAGFHVLVAGFPRVAQQLPVFRRSQSEGAHSSQKQHRLITRKSDDISFIVPFQGDPQFLGGLDRTDIDFQRTPPRVTAQGPGIKVFPGRRHGLS